MSYWRRKWQPTPVFLPEECHGQRSPAGHSTWRFKIRQDLVTKSTNQLRPIQMYMHTYIHALICAYVSFNKVASCYLLFSLYINNGQYQDTDGIYSLTASRYTAWTCHEFKVHSNSCFSYLQCCTTETIL